MAKEFTRKIRNTVLKGDRKEPFYTNKELDLLADKEDAYIRLKREYHCLTDNIKQLHSPDHSIIIDKCDKNNANISVEVGGVNLLDNSKNVRLNNRHPETWTKTSYKTDSKNNPYIEIEIVRDNTYINYFLYEENPFDENVTVSCEVKPSKDMVLSIAPQRGNWIFVKGGKWNKINQVNPHEIGIHTNHNNKKGDTLLIRNFKIEKGTVATDWTPSINDMKKYVDDEVGNVQRQLNSFIGDYREMMKGINKDIDNLRSRISALEQV